MEIEKDSSDSNEYLDTVDELGFIKNGLDNTEWKRLEILCVLRAGKLPVYFSKGADENDMILFCIHGAGLSAHSFYKLQEKVIKFASFTSYDIQGHGLNGTEENDLNLTINSLVSEA